MSLSFFFFMSAYYKADPFVRKFGNKTSMVPLIFLRFRDTDGRELGSISPLRTTGSIYSIPTIGTYIVSGDFPRR